MFFLRILFLYVRFVSVTYCINYSFLLQLHFFLLPIFSFKVNLFPHSYVIYSNKHFLSIHLKERVTKVTKIKAKHILQR